MYIKMNCQCNDDRSLEDGRRAYYRNVPQAAGIIHCGANVASACNVKLNATTQLNLVRLPCSNIGLEDRNFQPVIHL